jgi:peptidoglycan-N-acetylglucosamine deacetylase
VRVPEQVRARSAGVLRRASWWPTYPPRRLKDLAPLELHQQASTVALTFDDGPDPNATPLVLAALAQARVKATFFMCGLAIQRNRTLAAEVVAEGHTVGGHTWDHPELPGLSPASLAYQVDRCQGLLSELADEPVRLFRPPRGSTSPRLLRWLAIRELVPVLWSAHGRDWSEGDPSRIVANVEQMLEPGAIVLLHDGVGDTLAPHGHLPPDCHGDPTRTAAAVPELLELLERWGLRPVPLPRPSQEVPMRLHRRARFVPG